MQCSHSEAALLFWNEDNRKRDQMFYVAFCILASVLGDYATARDLEKHCKYDWGIAAYYYSILHSLRLLCFISTGDFPTSHSNLAQLFMGSAAPRDSWLQKLIGRDDRNREIRHALGVYPLTRCELIAGLERIHSQLSVDEINSLGNLLGSAKRLREAVTYEGLLSAHQHGHSLMTEAYLECLSRMRSASVTAIRLAVEAFKQFIENSERGEEWKRYLLWRAPGQGLQYIKDSVSKKLLGRGSTWSTEPCTEAQYDEQAGAEILSEIEGFLNPLEVLREYHYPFEGEPPAVYKNITVEVFDQKTNLMQEFRNYIEELRGILAEEFGVT